jgi:Icc protein
VSSSAKPMKSRLVQITDMHLFADADDVLVGMNCEEGFQDVLALIRKNETDIKAVLCTGDISQDNSAASYRRTENCVSSLGAPQYWIPGNHDEFDSMKSALQVGHTCFSRSFSVPGWRVVLLDSSVKGKVSGLLDAEELAALEHELAGATEKYVMICLHHNPVPVRAHWLQQHALKNPEALFSIVARYPAVKLVIFGHIHQEMTAQVGNVTCLASPSTSIQFHPDSHDFKLDTLNPGYRWLELSEDGSFRTGIERVPDKVYAIDFTGIGY